MGRISNYSQDTDVTKSDKLLGSDSGGSTKNYSLEGISNFFKHTNAAGVVGQFVWQYKNATPEVGQVKPTFSTGSTFANVTSLKVSKYIKGDTNSMQNILSLIAGKDILLIDTSDQDNYGLFSVSSVTQDGSTDNYDIALLYKGSGNGSLVVDKHYALVAFGGATDKTYTHEQDSGAATWSVTHNLGKQPSVTVVDVNNVQGYGIVTHTNANELTITFPGSTTGKAYCN